MKKMKAKHNEKDRIVCVSLPGKQSFYYQPVGTKEMCIRDSASSG